mmetsp:Transcript_18206/g.42373  ORF Transcript_18206/g.42373 Transcript_18206/m.42373 type:complete len:364 (-) Transcript_18206:183-1274(-)
MILYRSTASCVTLQNLCVVIWEKHIWQAALFAVPAALIAFLLKYYENTTGNSWLEGLVLKAPVYEAITFFVSFVVIFRMHASYDRFFEGCENSYNINGDLFDTCSLLTSFCRLSKAEESVVNVFQHKLVRLLSLLNALIYAELRTGSSKASALEAALDFEVLDAEGLDDETLRTLRNSKQRVEVVFYWIQSLIIESHGNGLLQVPPPVLSRVLVEVGAAMVKFHAVQNVAVVLFPFPLASTTELLLILQSCVTPVVIVNWTEYMLNAAVFGFVLVFVLWFLNGVAAELENPFDGGTHALNAHYMQRVHNSRLVSLMHPALKTIPHLTPHCEHEVLTLRQESRKKISLVDPDCASCGSYQELEM